MKITDEQMTMQCLEAMAQVVRSSKTMTKAQRTESLRLIAFGKSMLENLKVDNVAQARGAVKVLAAVGALAPSSN